MADPVRADSDPKGAMSQAAPAIKPPWSSRIYLKHIDRARMIVAVAMAVCGLGFVVCANHGDELRRMGDLKPDIWAWGYWTFGIGVLICLAATFALVVEYLARPAEPTPVTLRRLLARSALIVIAVAAVCCALIAFYGPSRTSFTAVGLFLLLAAVREHREVREILAVLAAIVLGLALWSMPSVQYARWHADEIVAAGCELMDRCPRTAYYAYDGHSKIDKPKDDALFGQEVEPTDPRVPKVLRKLGAHRIWVDEEHVAVFVEWGIEFQIYRDPHPTTTCDTVWGFRGKTSTKITDRLWTNDY